MRRLAFIDVLRGIAILAVVVHHLPEQFGTVFGALQVWGGRGVDLFFVLSGFLIGSTCLARAEKPVGPVTQAKAYWLLRTLRIWPLYYPLLVLFFLRVPPFHPEPGDVLRVHTWPYLFFFSNDIGQPSLELGVLWSLAIEEQFYLLIGILVMLASRRRDTLAAAFTAVGIAAVFVSLRARTDLIHLKGLIPDPDFTFRLFFSSLSRIDQLGLGLIAAVVAPRFSTLRWATATAWARATSWAAVGLVLAALMFFPQKDRIGFTLLGLVFAGSVLWLQRPAVRSASLSKVEALVIAVVGNAGKLSFGFYLFHPVTRRWFIALFERYHLPYDAAHAPLFLGGWVAASWAVAALSYRFFEEPILEYARKTSARWVEPAPAESASPAAAA